MDYLDNPKRRRETEPSDRTSANNDGFGAASTADPPADFRDRFEALTGQSLRECPHCHTGIMVVIDCIARPKVCRPVADTS
jgi:hypothetical protein